MTFGSASKYQIGGPCPSGRLVAEGWLRCEKASGIGDADTYRFGPKVGQDAPLTEAEVAAASDWPLEEGYISGSSSW